MSRKIFISHNSQDALFARELENQIKTELNDVEVFVSPRPGAIPMGKPWLDHVLAELNKASALVILITPRAENSVWVGFELGYFWKKMRKTGIYALYHPKARIPSPLDTLQAESMADMEGPDHFFKRLCQQFHSESKGIANLDVLIQRVNELSIESLEEQAQKAMLIRQMGSKDNATATNAVRELRAGGWLTDGSLEGHEFTAARLERAELKGANLQGTKINWANLQEADLMYANLEKADLGGSKFHKLSEDSGRAATFWHAILRNTILGSTILKEADLGGADLRGADLNGADLTDAHFTSDTVLPDGTTRLPDTDMSRFTNPNHPNFWRSDDPASPAYRQ